MVTPVRLAVLVFFLLVAPQVVAAVPIGDIHYVAAGGATEAPVAVANGDVALAIWNRGEGAVRFGSDARPLDVPAIALPKPQFTAGADLVRADHGWTVGWTLFELGVLAHSSLRLVDVHHDGTVANVREYALPEIVPQNAAMKLAARAGELVVAYALENGVAVAAIDARGRVSGATFDGTLFDLVDTPAGFALVLSDRIVPLTEDARRAAADIALPAGFTAHEAVTDGTDLLLAGITRDAMVTAGVSVLRIRGTTAEVLATIPDRGAAFARVARNGRDLLLVWKRGFSSFTTGPVSWDLIAARLPIDAADGTMDGPSVVVREDIDLTSRFACCVDPPAVVASGDGWTAVWSEGFRSAGGTSWRNLFGARVGAMPAPVAEPVLMTLSAALQWPVGTAVRDGVVLVVWQEAFDLSDLRTYAVRTTIAGQRLDAAPIDLGPLPVHAVRATSTGFALLRSADVVTIDANGATVSHPSPAPTLDLSCTSSLCLAAWTEPPSDDAPATVRISRWRDGALLDGPGVAVHHSDSAYVDLELAHDGERFLAAFARPVAPGGSILSVASVARTNEEWAVATSDVAASTSTINGLHLVFERDSYLAVWTANGQRASRLTREGHSTDGDETAWEGWPLVTGAPVHDMVFDGERTLIVTNDLERYVLHELRDRLAVPVSAGDAGYAASIECVEPHVCAITVAKSVRGAPWFRSRQLFLIGPPAKRRAARS